MQEKETYFFKPRMQALFDVLLLVDVGLIVAHSLNFFEIEILLTFIVISNIALIVMWFLVIRPVFQIVIADNKIFGPSDNFMRVSFPLRKVDHNRLRPHRRSRRTFGRRHIRSIEGPAVCLWGALLGRGQTGEILDIVDRYPFRDSDRNPSGTDKIHKVTLPKFIHPQSEEEASKVEDPSKDKPAVEEKPKPASAYDLSGLKEIKEDPLEVVPQPPKKEQKADNEKSADEKLESLKSPQYDISKLIPPVKPSEAAEQPIPSWKLWLEKSRGQASQKPPLTPLEEKKDQENPNQVDPKESVKKEENKTEKTPEKLEKKEEKKESKKKDDKQNPEKGDDVWKRIGL